MIGNYNDWAVAAVGNSGWFAGDFIPFKNCAYIFSIGTTVVGANLQVNYNVEQWQLAIQFSSTYQSQVVTAYQSYYKQVLFFCYLIIILVHLIGSNLV